MANFPFPAELPAKIEVEYIAAQRITRSPYSFRPQVIDRGGRVFRIVIEFQELSQTKAEAVGAWLRNLDCMANTFTLDLNPHCPGWDPAPGTRTFRLAEPKAGWASYMRVKFVARIEAYEDVA
jgi:hypothetical protein